jgi:hypothetical protein
MLGHTSINMGTTISYNFFLISPGIILSHLIVRNYPSNERHITQTAEKNTTQ